MEREKFRSNKGFTLIELLIVVAIIGLLSAIAVPMLIRVQERAKDKKNMTDMRNIAVALGIYIIGNDRVPITNDIDVLLLELNTSPSGSANNALTDIDAWGYEYQYQTTVNGSSYTLRSLGKDGNLGPIATQSNFNANADLIVRDGVFVASHEGSVSIVQ